MPIPLPTLDGRESLTIATPCHVPWGEMSGDDRSRFCGRCRRPVFDLSAMTTAEAAALLAGPGGPPCVRLYHRPDGQVLTTDGPAGVRVRVWRRLRRRAAWAASLFALLLLPACSSQQGMIVPPQELSDGPNAEAVREEPPTGDTTTEPPSAKP